MGGSTITASDVEVFMFAFRDWVYVSFIVHHQVTTPYNRPILRGFGAFSARGHGGVYFIVN
jgi:hypothetical protein